MKSLALLVLVLGCDGGSSSRLTGDWIDQISASSALGLTFDPDGAYTFTSILVTSATGTSANADVEAEAGTFSEASGRISFVPKTSSCPGPVPIWSAGYGFSGATLVLAGASGATSFAPNNSSSTTTVNLRFGCFVNGVLTPRPVAPVSN